MSDNKITQKQKIFNAPSSIPKRRQEVLKFNGWGYIDSKFSITEDKNIEFCGSRYELLHKELLPNFKEWLISSLGLDINTASVNTPLITKFDQSLILNEIKNLNLLNDIEKLKLDYSTEPEDRIFRAHGHTMQEIFILRTGKFSRVPDIVIWPRSHNEVVSIIDLASNHNVVIIPFGGGTSVTGALLCRENETRSIISVDMSQMNRILWLDESNLTVRMEAGIIGQDMENRLKRLGYCIGHEPDSSEFSSLGGWVATRASGMKKNVYGNIEDLLVHVTMVTPKGVIQKEYQAPRTSTGPDVDQFILGSEGTLGIITEVTLKIRPVPKFQKYASIIFPDFDLGFKALREIARQKIQPASIRLMDNEQFHFGLALKIARKSIFARFSDGIKKLYLLKYKGFDPYKLCVATIVMESGSKNAIIEQERCLLEIASQFNGISGGEENGRRGYLLTYVIAYIRDLGMDNFVLAESFETSVPWDRALDMCVAVKKKITDEAKLIGITKPILITCRVTQLYDAGVCIYFYLGVNYSDLASGRNSRSPVELYEHLESEARNEILSWGGSLSHHHGVGKIRKRWLERVISPTGMLALQGLKQSLDPANMFANGALFDDSKLSAKL